MTSSVSSCLVLVQKNKALGVCADPLPLPVHKLSRTQTCFKDSQKEVELLNNDHLQLRGRGPSSSGFVPTTRRRRWFQTPRTRVVFTRSSEVVLMKEAGPSAGSGLADEVTLESRTTATRIRPDHGSLPPSSATEVWIGGTGTARNDTSPLP